MRELDYALKKISSRKAEAYKFRAALHGVKLEPLAKKEQIADPKKAEIASRAMQEAIELRKARQR